MPLHKNLPFFSVVIPTYNRADKLARALESLVGQIMRDFEVIVCDDGSTDGTGEVVSAFADKLKISYLWEGNWGGPARPRNRGISAATGEWICFLDADDWWYPEKLAVVLPATTDADLIYHDCDTHGQKGKKAVGKQSRQLVAPVFVDLMTTGCSIVTSSVCVKKALLEKVGGFAEEKELVAIEDFDLWLRISLATGKFLHIPRRLGAYWVDEENISCFSERYIIRETAVIRKYVDNLCKVDRKEADRLLAYKIGLARKYLGQFKESRGYFRVAMQSRRLKIKLYAALYYLLALIENRYIIP